MKFESIIENSTVYDSLKAYNVRKRIENFPPVKFCIILNRMVSMHLNV